jgi:hypothetical protein
MALRESDSVVAKLADEAVFEINNPNLFAGGVGTTPSLEPTEE